jgi:hypothetical protein
MDAKVDYISFTCMVDCRGAGEGDADSDAAQRALYTLHPAWWKGFAAHQMWEKGSGRGHYGTSRYNADTFAAVRFGGSANHILVEMPGTACQWARDNGVLYSIIDEAAERLTRIDIAVDIPSGCSPSEFVQAGYGERWKSHATIISPEGATEYVGSMKSDRFARAYMYAPPHPRAGVLRVEHVLRAEYAKAAAARMAGGSVLDLAAACGAAWGWQSPFWKPGDLTDGKLKAKRADRHEPGRVRWLYDVVVPSLVKADAEGLIDLADFWRTVAAFKAARQGGTTDPASAIVVEARSLKKRAK